MQYNTPSTTPHTHHIHTTYTPHTHHTDLLNDLKAKEKQIETLKSSLALAKAANLGGLAVTTATGAPYVVERLDGVDAKAMQDAAASVQAQLGEQGAVVLGGSPEEGKVVLVAAFGKEVWVEDGGWAATHECGVDMV